MFQNFTSFTSSCPRTIFSSLLWPSYLLHTCTKSPSGSWCMVAPSEFHLGSKFRQSLAIHLLVCNKEAGLQTLRSRTLAINVLKAVSLQSGVMKKPHTLTFPQDRKGGCHWSKLSYKAQSVVHNNHCR